METIELLNRMFAEPFVRRDGREILSRLRAGDDFRAMVAEDYSERFGSDKAVVDTVLQHWSGLHFEAVEEVLKWALTKLDGDERLSIKWKGDAEHPDMVTKFEVREDELVIEFAHPASWTKDVIRDIMMKRRAERQLARAS